MGCSSPQNPNISSEDAEQRLASDSLDSTISITSIDIARLNAAIFYATNEARTEQGLSPVEHSPLLEELATAYAERVVETGVMSHVDPETNKAPKDRFAAAGIINPFASENLATDVLIQMEDGEALYPIDPEKGLFSRESQGEPLPFHTYSSLGRSFVNSWLNSPGHRRNLLAKEAVQLGAGVAFDASGSFSNQFPVVVGVQKFQNYESLALD
jgi:uncharacterized protein YkwD